MQRLHNSLQGIIPWFSLLIGMVGLFQFYPCSAQQSPLPSVVSLSICTDSYVLALADSSQIKALSYLGADPLYSPYADKAKGIPVHHGKADEILSLKPSLALTDKYASSFLVSALKTLGTSVIPLPEAQNFPEIENNIQTVGRLLHQEERAKSLIEWHKTRVLEVSQHAQLFSPHTALFYRAGGWSVPFSPLVHTMWKMAGLSPPSGLHAGENSPSLEKLILLKPDIILRESVSDQFHSLDENFSLSSLLGVIHSQSLPFPVIWGLCDTPQTIQNTASLQRLIEMRTLPSP